MNFDYKKRTILLTLAGSRAYGTSTPTSDVDVKGVIVTPKAYRDGFLNNFEQLDKPGSLSIYIDLLPSELQNIVHSSKLDGAIYDIRKFFKLAAACNPNILDALFCHSDDVIFVTKPGRLLIDNRQKFISLKALYTFKGYAISQAERIRTHRRWLLEPKHTEPLRSEFMLHDDPCVQINQLSAALSMVTKKIDSWEIDFCDMDDASKIYILEQLRLSYAEICIASSEKFKAAARIIGFSENFIDLLDREHRYRAAHDDWKHYCDWKLNRNEARAKLEAKFGYDTKHAQHLCRLMTMCREILIDGTVNVRRPDAEFLLSIRNGAWTYEHLMKWADEQNSELIELAKKSTLPKKPDYNLLDELCVKLTEKVDRDNE